MCIRDRAITTSAINGIGMGLTTTVILAASNLMISLLRNFIPDSVRMPAYIVVVAVSYTHLDVYKRQILYCDLHQTGRTGFRASGKQKCVYCVSDNI